MSRAEMGKLPEGWRWVRLGEVCEEKTGTKDPRLQPSDTFNYVDISSVDNSQKRILYASVLFGKDAPSRARQVIKAGDVLVSTTRPNLNAVALVPHDLDNQICSTGFCVLRPKKELDCHYLFAYVRSPKFVKNISDLVKGALYPAITDKQVKAQVISLPPLPEQKRIAAILNEQLAAVEKARAAAKAQLEAGKARPGAYLRKVFKDKTGEKLPEGWRWIKVKDVCSQINYGYTASADFYFEYPKFLRITDIQNGNVEWNNVPSCQIDSSDEESYRLYTGDIVFARTGGTTGKSFLIEDPPRAVFASYLIRLRPKNEMLSDFLYSFFQSTEYWQQIRNNARGGAQPNVNASLLGSLFFPLPPVSFQKRIAAILNEQIAEADKLRKSINIQLDTIKSLPAALLRQVFGGKL